MRERQVSASEAVRAAIERIERLNPAVNAVVTTTFDLALEAAERADKLAAAGNWLGPLHGVPILIKDLFDFRAGIRNTFGCPAMVDFVPDQTVAYIARLEDAGAIILGKTNTPEFGHKGTTDNRLFGPTRCPFDLSRNAGGSSGGSAAAVAVGMVPLAQGSDAGGSIRIPAAWCGVVGFKPPTAACRTPARRTRFSPTRRLSTPGRWRERSATRHSWRRSCPGRTPTTRSACPRRWHEPGRIAGSGRRQIAPRLQSRLGRVRRGTRRWHASSTNASRRFAVPGCRLMKSTLRLPLDQDELAALWCREVGVLYLEMFDGMARGGRDLLTRFRRRHSAADPRDGRYCP